MDLQHNDRKCLSIESYKQKQCDSIGFTNKSKESVRLLNEWFLWVSSFNESFKSQSFTELYDQWTALDLLFSVKQVLHQYQNCLYSFVLLKMNICWYSTARRSLQFRHSIASLSFFLWNMNSLTKPKCCVSTRNIQLE